ncbi:AbgT family transporter [Prevotella falsenii]|uniref:AbgT family transporter n=1 Tax=Prevotella falsenii TaxID=515414 RepID=UPI00046AE57D|nr:AbgT family transporter [Prevotella falsenii]
MKNKYGIIALGLMVLQLLIVFGSWLVTAAFPDVNINSLLSGRGFRWFVGQFTNNLKSDILIWLLLLSIAWGVYRTSGLHNILCKLIDRNNKFADFRYRERVGIRLALFDFVCFIALSIIFAMLPESPLLSVTGSLFPSSFSLGLVPALSFIVIVSSLSYGIACGKLKTVSEVYNSISSGLVFCSKLFPMYILVVQLFYTIAYVFNLNLSIH